MLKFKAQYVGCDTWQNLRTGEKRTIGEYMKPIGLHDPFFVTYIYEILRLFESLGNKKMKIIKFIITKMDKNYNTLKMTQRQIAKSIPASKTTVSATIKLLLDADLIKIKRGQIMISPKFINNWQAKKEANMLIKFKDFGTKNVP